MKEEYRYESGEIYDDLYNVTMSLDRLFDLLNSNKNIKKADKELLIDALTIISKLEKV